MGSWERYSSYLKPLFLRRSELERDGTFDSIQNFLSEQREPLQPELAPETRFNKAQKALIIGLMVGLPYVALVAIDHMTNGTIQDYAVQRARSGTLP